MLLRTWLAILATMVDGDGAAAASQRSGEEAAFSLDLSSAEAVAAAVLQY